MNTGIFKVAVLAVLVAAGSLAQAQRAIPKRAASAPTDVATLKQKAEAGDVAAKLALGIKLRANDRSKDALAEFKEIGRKGNAEACYQAGDILLYGTRESGAQSVTARPAEGIRWTYRAATNFHAQACRNMARARATGLGIKTNVAEAYAWMQLYAERCPKPGRSELDALALSIDTATIKQGQSLAKQFKAKKWPRVAVENVTRTQLALKVSGITHSPNGALVVVNHRSLAVGEATQFTVGNEMVEVRCIEIGDDFARVEVEGEDEPRRLVLGRS
jgi:TPR repeat protein